jgi:hypothetical protein
MEDAQGIKWDIIHLGPIMPIGKERYAEGWAFYEGKSLGTHAYIISLECVRKISVFEPELVQVPVDFHLNRLPLRTFCVRRVSCQTGVSRERTSDGALKVHF